MLRPVRYWRRAGSGWLFDEDNLDVAPRKQAKSLTDNFTSGRAAETAADLLPNRYEGSMRKIAWCALTLLAIAPFAKQEAIAAQTAAPTTKRSPAEAYGRLPATADAAISPDGKKVIVALSDEQGGQAFTVLEFDAGKQVTLIGISAEAYAPERPVLREVGWADDTHASFLMSATFRSDRVVPGYVTTPGRSRLDVWRAGIADLTNRRNYYVSHDKENDWGLQLAGLIAPIADDPGKGRLVTYNGPYRDRELAVYSVNLISGRAATLVTGNRTTVDFEIDARGEAVARVDVNDHTNRWQLFALEKGGQARLLREGTSDTGAPPTLVGLLPDGGLTFIADPDQRGRDVLYAIDPKDGAQRVLLEDPKYEVSSAIADPWSHQIVGAFIQEEAGVQRFLEPDLAEVLKRAQALDPSAVVWLKNWSRDRSRFVLYIERVEDAGGFYVFEPATKRLRLIGLRYPQLKGSQLGTRQAVTFPARDGTRIPGYLTLPPDEMIGAAPRSLPLVVLVHGGPSARDTFTFDWWASFLASRGYAVMQPNYRGSDGYGRAWEEAGYRQWGELMQHDVEDAAASLTRMGIVDGKRICIAGASYGGYAALAGATLTPDRYRCAISVAGVADLPMMLDNVEVLTGADSMASDWWHMLIGDRSDNKDHLRDVSPAYQAAHASAPILLIHGANDTVVPIAQSRRMAAQLKSAGKQVRLVEFPGEDHWLSDAVTRTQMLKEIETFLGEQLGTTTAAETVK